MDCDKLPEEIIIPYMGQDVKVHVDCTFNDTRFIVFLPGEEGNLTLQIDTDEDGNETWCENGQSTPRANEIGKLIEISDT